MNNNEFEQFFSRNNAAAAAGLKSEGDNDDMSKISSNHSLTTLSSASSMKNTAGQKMRLLRPDFQPTPYHVLCARGSKAKNWQGNRFLRSLVDSAVPRYQAATSRMEKTVIVSEIIEAIQRQTDDGVAFVKEVDGRWYQISDSLSREKIGQLFRERLHGMYKSSTKAKRRKQKMMNENTQRRLNETLRHSTPIAESIDQLNQSSVMSRSIPSGPNFETALTRANVEILGHLKTDISSTPVSAFDTNPEQPIAHANIKMDPEKFSQSSRKERDTAEEDICNGWIPQDFPFLDIPDEDMKPMYQP